jgi:hypothetical protein
LVHYWCSKQSDCQFFHSLLITSIQWLAMRAQQDSL